MTQAQTDGGDTALEWTVWPARRRPVLSIIVAALILGLSVGAVLVYQSPWYGVMVTGGLFVATVSYYLPTRYRLDAEGVGLRTPLSSLRRSWDGFAVCFEDHEGLLLSPSSRLTWAARHRGVYLRFEHNSQAVREFVHRHVKSAGSTSG
ncbi:MAG TPA: hypothetical protein DGT21_06275 [Armatimonadetes bacterium]|jgi:hypothetical protein|nr:hypothetical protein [Armatimonadota bacterium]